MDKIMAIYRYLVIQKFFRRKFKNKNQVGVTNYIYFSKWLKQNRLKKWLRSLPKKFPAKEITRKIAAENANNYYEKFLCDYEEYIIQV